MSYSFDECEIMYHGEQQLYTVLLRNRKAKNGYYSIGSGVNEAEAFMMAILDYEKQEGISR